ncbi:hypothetical protein FisN_29Lh023 [Fistulifera solaris]|uniref:Leishmanolysin-like peptidase n=1 Tax=Fistulifera solaris TaxID=1519565 RepID=A0A1Z5JM06_FISSO|nr:hypothetical protein FisN_29Lh023 [Fistulifera solaris]|eukprot:GAX14818.1 hypothetical protein FisN_29Lh023 [Fistulifera solaris]
MKTNHLSNVSVFWIFFITFHASVQGKGLRSDEEQRELLLNSCQGCGMFRNRMRRINPDDDSCVEQCRPIGSRWTSDWECGTCEEWNQSYPGFDTTLILRNVRNSQLQAVFRNAATEWNQIITGDLPSIQLPSTAKQQSRFCTARSIPQVIDDILICVNVQAIDGPGRVLGQAGAEFIRRDSSIPLMGGMVFDEADVDFMVQQGIFDEVILHEIGHVYGINGAIWKIKGLTDSTQRPCNYKLDSAASTEWQLMSGCVGTSIPIENDGGPGTSCSHFDELSLTNELMTGFVRNAVPLLSRLTVATLEDIGYKVNYDAAKPFTGVNASVTCSLPESSSSSQEEREEMSSDSGRDYAIQYGMNWLKSQPSDANNNGRVSSTNIAYIGDQMISVVYVDDAGEVRHVALTSKV